MLRASLLAASALALAACAPKSEAPAASVTPAAAATPTPAAIPAFTAGADAKPFPIGAFQAVALRDGAAQFPNDAKTFAINKTRADVAALLKANNAPADMIDVSIQPLLVNTGAARLLFDTGAAAAFGPGAGKLPASLAQAGAAPADITDIFISHAHGDHVAGLVTAEGKPAFPNARVHISANEWTAMQADKAAGAIARSVAAQVVTFQPGADIVPGVKAVDIPGHTPGHSGYLIASGDASLLYIGDTMHSSIISVQQPDWTVQFDGKAALAQESRKKLLADSAASGQRIYAVHFPFPGLGKFETAGDHQVWVAEK